MTDGMKHISVRADTWWEVHGDITGPIAAGHRTILRCREAIHPIRERQPLALFTLPNDQFSAVDSAT